MSGCSGGGCNCAEKDKQIMQFKSTIERLQSKKLVLQATNLNLQEQLDDCTKELEARLTCKEDEVQALKGTCKAMSSHVLVCQEKAVALEEELVKKEELLRVASATTAASFNWPVVQSPRSDSSISPRSMHSISIQTSPRRDMPMITRTMSCTSEELSPSSARSEAAPYFAEMQELRYTVRVLKEELEELQSAPATPMDLSSPKRGPACASLADMLDLNAKLRLMLPIDTTGGSSLASPLSSPTPMSKPSFTHGGHLGLDFQDPSTLEHQVLHTLLISELYAAEGIGRQAIGLEHDGALQELQMTHSWAVARHRLLVSSLLQLQQLEACEREKLLANERSYHDILLQDQDESQQCIQRIRSRSVASSHKEALENLAMAQFTMEEVKTRQVIETEEGAGAQEIVLFFDWISIQRDLHITCIKQIVQLELLQREHLLEAENNFRKILYEEKDESVRQAVQLIRSFRLPLDHVGLLGTLHSQFLAAEDTTRQVIEVQESSAMQEMLQLHRTLMEQQRWFTSSVGELEELESIQRRHIAKNEQSFYEMFVTEESESAHQASITLRSRALNFEHQHHQQQLLLQFLASEATLRASLDLKQDAAARQLEMFRDWCQSQLRLATTGLLQLQDLEERARGKLRSKERSTRVSLKNEMAESCNLAHAYSLTPRVMESRSDEVLNAALESHILACEAMGRTALTLDEECGRQALKMYDDWHQSQRKLLFAATHQLFMLEAAERGRLIQTEETSWSLLQQDDLETPWTPKFMSSLASSVGEDINSSLLMEELQDLWALREHLHNSSVDGTATPVSSSASCEWGQVAAQSLFSRQRRALRLLVQQESNDWARLIWCSDVEFTRCVYNSLLQTQLSHGRLAESIESEEEEARNALKDNFESELLGCLQSIAKRRCAVKVCEVWENERWIPMTGWSKGLLERPHFSDATGRTPLDLSDFDSIIAQQSMCWSSQGWELDISSSVDFDGWQYALAFNTPFHPAPWFGALVRHRKWVRACEPLPAPKVEAAANPQRRTTDACDLIPC